MARRMDHLSFTLETERLLLRPWRRADLDAMAAWPLFPDPLDRVWNWPQQLKQTASLDLFFASHTMDPARRAWTILHTGAPIGLLQLKNIREAEGAASFGIALGAPWIGQGFGHEALAAFLVTYFKEASFKALHLEVALSNTRARKLYDRLGFAETSRFWRHAGPAEEYRFLAGPAYAHLQPYFRWTASGVYQLCAEMSLTATDWRRMLIPL